MRSFSYAGLLVGGLLFTGCETHQPVGVASSPPSAAVPALARPAAGPHPDTADCTRRLPMKEPGPADTLIALGARHYWLTMQVSTDSTQALYAAPAGSVGPAFAAPGDAAGRVRGYAETYTFTLRDSARRAVLFRRRLHKPDFYGVAPRDLATVMHLERPSYLGYSASLDALVFACYLWVPASDVGERATLVLGRNGRVQTISPGGAILWEAPDCDPQLSPDGRTVLTCSELLRPGQPALSLRKPHAELRAARFLNDSTLLTLYEYGDVVPRASQLPTGEELDSNITAPMTESEFVTTPAQRRLPTAFVMRTSGRVVRSFRLTTTGAASSELPRAFLPAAGAYFCYDENTRHLVVLPKAHPERLTDLPLKTLAVFKPPRRAREKQVALSSDFTQLTLFVDTLHPQVVRYRLQAKMGG
jgi:hypothetical protein